MHFPWTSQWLTPILKGLHSQGPSSAQSMLPSVRKRPGRVAGSVENQVEKPSRWQVVSTTPGTLVQITERANCITSLFGASLNSTLSSSNLPGITFTKQWSTMNCMGFRGLTNNNETWEVWDFPTFFLHFVIILSKTNSKQNLLHLSINSYPTESGVHGPPFIPRAIHSTARFCRRCLPRVWRNRKIHHIQTCKKMYRCQNVAWKRSIWSFGPDKTIAKPIQNMFEI